METDHGKRVSIRFNCRLEDGRIYLVGDGNTLEFVIGAGSVPPSLETGLLGMREGDHRFVRVPHAELDRFPFPRGSHFAFATGTAPGIAYEFGPGNGGDVSLAMPGKSREHHEPIPAGADLFFEVEVLSVQDPEVKTLKG